MLVNWITSDLFINYIGLIATLMLTVLLVIKEFVRTVNRSGARSLMRRLDIAIVPLLIMFALVVIGRIVSL